MAWSSDPSVHELCKSRILEVAAVENDQQRMRKALGYIEYLGAHPNEAGDHPITFCSVLAFCAASPSSFKKGS